MKMIENIQHLEPFGIVPLTGESDKHMYRILCDVTAKGKAIIERTMDVQLTLHDNWNGGSKDDPHIGSLLLPFEFIPAIAVFALLSHSNVTEAWLLKSGTVLGFGVEDVDRKDTLRAHYDGQLRKVFYAMASDRNLHVFTGRTV